MSEDKKTMLRRQSSSVKSILCGAKRVERTQQHPFDYFLVVGEDQNNKITTLFHFPSEKPPPYEAEIFHFCLPNGSSKKKLTRSSSGSSLNELLFGQLSDLEKSSNSFIFVLTVGEKLLYGICVLSKELHNSFPSFKAFFDSDKKSNKSSLSDDYFSSSRCYCFISQFPFFDAHFNVLYSILAYERLHKLQTMTSNISEHSPPECPIIKDSPSFELILNYYQIPLPHESRSQLFTIANDPVCCVNIPSGTELQLLSEWGVPILFRLFSLDDILIFFNALLLEKSVVFICDNPGILSAAVLSIIPLIFPLVWQGPLITILPTNLQEYLDSPVPIIAGMQALPPNTSSWNDHIVMDLNTKTVKKPNKNFPTLPERKKLMNDLKGYYSILHDNFISSSPSLNSNNQNSNHVNTSLLTRKSTKEELDTVDNAIVCFRKYTSWVVDEFTTNELSLSNTTTISKFKTLPRGNNHLFLRELIGTQQYAVHTLQVNNLLEDTQASTLIPSILSVTCPVTDDSAMFTSLDNKISQIQQQKTEINSQIRYLLSKVVELDSRLSTLQAAKIRLRDEVANRASPKEFRRARAGTVSHRRNKSWMN